MNVTVNKKTELAAVFFSISNYKKLYPHLNEEFEFTIEYKNNMFDWFDKFKNHSSVKLFNDIVEELSFAYDAPLELFLHLNENFSYDEEIIFNESTLVSEFITTKEEKKLFLDFLEILPDFVENSNFEDYYKSNNKFYEKCVEIGEKPINEFNILERLSKFIKDDNFYTKTQINLLPFTTGNCGLTIKGEPYPNYGLDADSDKLEFGTKHLPLVIHELLHSKINPLTKKNLNIVKDFEFSEYGTLLREYAYIDGNSSIINEYVVRAVESIITNDIWSSEERYQQRLELQKSGGFAHIEWVIEEIKNMNESEKIDAYYEKFLNKFLEHNKTFNSKEQINQLTKRF